MLKNGSEALTTNKCDGHGLVFNAMFLRRTAGYTKLDRIRNTNILEELLIDSVL